MSFSMTYHVSVVHVNLFRLVYKPEMRTNERKISMESISHIYTMSLSILIFTIIENKIIQPECEILFQDDHHCHSIEEF